MAVQSRRVAVIGAGISGVVAAAHLKKEGLDVVVFERSSAAGGIWRFEERKPLDPSYSTVPISQAESTDPDREVKDFEKLLHAPPGPCYVGLRNNVSTRLLETTLKQFPKGTEDYVTHKVLAEYIQDIAISSGVHDITQFDTSVRHVSKTGGFWKVETTTLKTNASGVVEWRSLTQEFDAVVVASGHYHSPRIPNTPGLADWKRRWPERVEHSKRYRRPENAQGKNYLLVGGSVSAMDVARELSPHANRIYQSQRNGAFDQPSNLLPDNAYRVEEIVSYDAPAADNLTPLSPSETVPATVTLKSGAKLCDIHHVILCTGYHLTLPFLPQLHSDTTPVDKANDRMVVTDGTQFHNLHKDIFYIEDPTLAFIGVPFFTATFTLFEFQAMVVAKVLSSQASLPSKAAMRSEYIKKVKRRGYGKAFHSLRGQEVAYVNELIAWVNCDLERAGKGKLNGHTDRWHNAMADSLERMRALSATHSVEKKLEVTCM